MSAWALICLVWTVGVIAAVAAGRSAAARMEAVARACHELRGPITAVRLGLTLAGRTGELSAAQLRAIDRELGRASLALDDLERAPRRRAPRHVWLPVDLEAVVSDCVEAWRPAAVDAQVELELHWPDGAVSVRGDEIRLAQAIDNLIANAIEHGGGAVVVCGRLDGTRVRVEVTDVGPGLPAPVAVLAARPHGGRGRRGRGLAIASGVAESHGGRLSAAPSDRGARLVLELPVAWSEGESAVPAP